jgi:hypothetical protein
MTTERKYIGHDDHYGTPIHVGDIVEFWFDEVQGASVKREHQNQTFMRDLVTEDGGKFWFECGCGGAYPHRFASVCYVAGSTIKTRYAFCADGDDDPCSEYIEKQNAMHEQRAQP